MNIAIWIIQVLAAFVFIMAGWMKLTQPFEKLAERMNYVKSFSPTQIRLIGTAEVTGALGLILPGLTRILPVLTPIAAVCLVLLMCGAIYTHIRLHEVDKLKSPALPLVLALLVAIGRIWVLPL